MNNPDTSAMKCPSPLFLLRLLLFVPLFELLWVGDCAPSVAPPAEKKTHATLVTIFQVEPGAKGRPEQGEEKKIADADGGMIVGQ